MLVLPSGHIFFGYAWFGCGCFARPLVPCSTPRGGGTEGSGQTCGGPAPTPRGPGHEGPDRGSRGARRSCTTVAPARPMRPASAPAAGDDIAARSGSTFFLQLLNVRGRPSGVPPPPAPPQARDRGGRRCQRVCRPRARTRCTLPPSCAGAHAGGRAPCPASAP